MLVRLFQQVVRGLDRQKKKQIRLTDWGNFTFRLYSLTKQQW